MKHDVGYNIYLPPEYAKSDRRFHVVYDLHGSNGSGLASADVSLGSVPLSDTVSPGGAADWTLSGNSPVDGQLNIALSAKPGHKITSNTGGGSLVTIIR